MSRDSALFLKAFREARGESTALDVIADDPDGFAAALSDDVASLAQAIEAAGDAGGGAASVPARAFASAACRSDGRIVASDEAFAAFELPTAALSAALSNAASDTPSLSAITDDGRGRPVAVAVARLARASAWPLDAAVRAALVSGAADFGVLAVRSSDGVDWGSLFAAWNFSPSETRLAASLVSHGDLRQAAADAGVAYETARDTLATIMAKTGARRQPELVSQLAQLAFGDLPNTAATWSTLADTYGLSVRQGRLAQLVALGATRATAASALRISDQSAKADLKVIYERCGIDGGASLGRVVAETDALARLAAATDVEILTPGRVATPLRFVRRSRASGRIAVEDHGPDGGAPVFVFHTPSSGRHLPRRLVSAMHARGLRPIAVERPAFGLTSPSEDGFVEAANADLIDVLDTLGLARVKLLGRSLAMPLRFAAAHPKRVIGGVLIAPTPPGVVGTQGLLGTAIRIALDHPQMVGTFARMMSRLSSERAIIRLTERALGSSPTDMAALQDPTNRADWIQASRQSAMGDGFGREYVVHADGGEIPQEAKSFSWTVLIGGQDSMALAIEDGPELWRAALPKARIEIVPEAGRLMVMSHPEIVADSLGDIR